MGYDYFRKQVAEAFREIQGRKREEREEASRILGFYKEAYPSTRSIIEKRDKAEITKELKGFYGRTYENGDGWSAYPDKIVFRDSPGAGQVQITWGRFTTKLVDLLERFQEVEEAALERDNAKCKEADTTDAEFEEIEELEEPGDGQETPPEAILEAETDPEPAAGADAEKKADPEAYTTHDVRMLLFDCRGDLWEYRDAFADEECPPPLLQRQRIIVDALDFFVQELKKEEEGEAG